MLLFSRLGFSRAVRHIAGANNTAVCARHVAIGLMVAFGVVTGCGTDKSNSSSKQRTTSTTGGTSAVVSSQGGDRLESDQQAPRQAVSPAKPLRRATPVVLWQPRLATWALVHLVEVLLWPPRRDRT